MLRRLGYGTLAAEGGEEAMEILEGRGLGPVDLVVLDLAMPGLDGKGVLQRMAAAGSEIPVVVQTAHGSIETVIAAMKAGAFDFVVKPVGAERLAVSVKNALRAGALETELRRMAATRLELAHLQGPRHPQPDMERVVRLAERAARSSIPVLIEGESGVGKELLARAIQGSSERRGKAFVTVNCGAIPDNLVDIDPVRP